MRLLALWVISVWILQPVNAQTLTSALADDQLPAFRMQHFPAFFQPLQLKSDFLLSGGSANFYSNIFYLKNTGILDLRSKAEVIMAMQENENAGSKMDAIGLGFHTGRSRYQAAGQATFHGPSFWYKINSDWSVGVYSRMSVMGSAGDIPDEINYPTFDSKRIHQSFQIRTFSGHAISMASVGFHAARYISINDWEIKAGINLQWNFGLDMVGIRMNQDIAAYTKLNNNSVRISNASVHWQFTSTNQGLSKYTPEVNGHGASIDFGFAIRPKKSSLKWEAILSLNQLGFIEYKKSTESHDITFDQVKEFNSSDFGLFTDLQSYSAKIQSYTMGSDSKGNPGTRVMVPTSGSVSGSFLIHLDSHVQLQSLFSMPFSNADSRMMLGVQYDFRYWRIFPYATLTNWQTYSPGLSIRAGYFTLGSNNVSAFFMSERLDHADFHFLFSYNWSERSRKKIKNNSYNKCYSF